VAFSPQANYTDWSIAAAGEVLPTFTGRGCCVVSAANPFGHQTQVLQTKAATFSFK
jgi:hypothetical protein